MKRSSASFSRSNIHGKLSKITGLCPEMSLFNVLYSKEQAIDNVLTRKACIYKRELGNRGFELNLMRIQVISTFGYEPPIPDNTSVNENLDATADRNYNLNQSSELPQWNTASESPNTWYLTIRNFLLDPISHNDIKAFGSIQPDQTDTNCSEETSLRDMFSSIYIFRDEEQTILKSTMYVKDKNNQSPPIISSNATYSPEGGFRVKFPLNSEQPTLRYKIVCSLNQFTTQYKLNSELATVIGCNGGSFPRILCSLYNYIHCNNLLSENDMCLVMCDDKLKRVFATDQFYLKDVVVMLPKFFERPDPIIIKNVLANPAFFPANTNNQSNTGDNQFNRPPYFHEEFVPVEVPTCYNHYLKRIVDVFGPRLTIDDAISSFKSDSAQENQNKITANDEDNSRMITLHEEINHLINECVEISGKIEHLNRFVKNPRIQLIDNFKICEYESDKTLSSNFTLDNTTRLLMDSIVKSGQT